VPRDSEGRPILPLQIGPVTIHRLGTVVYDRPGFHSDKMIYPVGYLSSRSYMSLSDPSVREAYFTEIIDCGGPAPRYRIWPESDPEHRIEQSSSSSAWGQLIRVSPSLLPTQSGECVLFGDVVRMAYSRGATGCWGFGWRRR